MAKLSLALVLAAMACFGPGITSAASIFHDDSVDIHARPIAVASETMSFEQAVETFANRLMQVWAEPSTPAIKVICQVFVLATCVALTARLPTLHHVRAFAATARSLMRWIIARRPFERWADR